MVVLAASIISKTGHLLLSRQFLPIPKIRVEGLLAAFPKLLGTDSQHTFVETESVRYVYQPIEQLYLILVTNKQSNIMEDLDTLKLLAKIIPEYSEGYSEAQIEKSAFELIFAFDEVINLGYKENLTLTQVKQFMEMDSHEERLYKIIMASKMDEARNVIQRKAEEIDRRKAELMKQATVTPPSYSDYHFPQTDYTIEDEESPTHTTKEEPIEKKAIPKKEKEGVSRMILSKGKKTQDEFLSQLNKEEKFQPSEEPAPEEQPEPESVTKNTDAESDAEHPVAGSSDEKGTGKEEREGTKTQSQEVHGPKFCGECGRKRAGIEKFCMSCGWKYPTSE